MTRRIPDLSRRRALTLGLTAAAGTLAGCSTAPANAPASTQPPSSSTPPAGTGTTPASPDPSHAAGAPAVEVMRGKGDRQQVALTFHGSGDLAIVHQLMDILAQHNTHITVMCIGKWLAANPSVAKLLTGAGHELGNHTWSHQELSTFQPEPMLAEITRCRDELVKLTGSPGAFFRQSDGQHPTPEELVQAGKAGYARILSYDVDSTDWKGASPPDIRKAVATATAGSVVSLHFGRSNTVAALPDVLTDLHNRGLTPVTATELLR